MVLQNQFGLMNDGCQVDHDLQLGESATQAAVTSKTKGSIDTRPLVLGRHTSVSLYIEPVTQFLGMAPLKWEWQWTLLFSLTLFLLPLNLAINAHPDDD